jgi:hypothetical protein
MRRTLLVVIVVAALAFLFLAPVVYVQPQGVFLCSGNGCNFPMYGSVTYWAFNVGGVWMDRGYYTVIL